MKSYIAQPLDLMQYINTKFHEPFIHELLEFENGVDDIKLTNAITNLAKIFPNFKMHL